MPDYILYKDLKEGMVLAEPILNNFGQLIIPINTKLHAKHLKLLKVWNLQGVMILNDDDKKEFVISPLLRKKIREHILTKFSISNRNEINANLLNDLLEMGIIYHAKRVVK